MPIRSILAVFNGTKEELPMLDMACELATQHQAQLKVLHVLPDPQVYDGFYAGQTIVISLEKENQQCLAEAKRLFKMVTERHSIQVLGESEKPPARHASISFLHRTDVMEHIVAEEGRFTDLILLHNLPRDKATTAYECALTAALFDSASPVLLLPAKKPEKPLDHTVAIAWKEGKEAMRAVEYALPFLTRAEKVHVLRARTYHKSPEVAEQKILSYLALHGINADMHIVDKKGVEVGETVLAKARELNAGLLVMGGYGHSRFREIVFGGVTEYVLNHADLPVLMAH